MRDLCNNPKWKVDSGQFKSRFYGELEKRIVMTFPGSDLRACPHIESKIKIWWKHYGLLYEMTELSGFRWNDTEKMVLVDSDDVWENFVWCEFYANKSFPYYEDWLVLFGKDRATCELAEDPADEVEAIAVEEAMGEMGDGSPARQLNVVDFECSMSTNGNASNSSTFSKGGTKRGRTTEGITSNIATMTETLGSFLDKMDTRLADTCKKSEFPDLCNSTLRSDPRSAKADAKGLALIMLEVALTKASTTFNQVKKLLSKATEPVLKECLTLCTHLYGSIVEEIPKAIQNVGSDNNEAIHQGDLAITDADTCEGIFSEEPNKRKSPITANNIAVQHLVGIAEDILASLG
ncbi:Cell wall / vacuolar inhibitor of fructosidase 2 [Camellia lanceoleosa]|uniref:Cell wall / vacuolar inhibitor of fructosidase 2 n=1 Tax=Camellia lanceoleosa TaxID=1840588 RepID=A0ACC0IVR1_9ERIC|nr:Cell wall / vacuolar inhibitor of fructosidase 2 [Camellia lanceoleosa]